MWIWQEFMVPCCMVWFVRGRVYTHSYQLGSMLDAVLAYLDRVEYYIVKTPLRGVLT